MNGWSLRYSGVDPADEGRREALCTLGNGVFATRGSAPEHVADGVHYPGTYAAGIYNRLTDQIDGTRITNESLVNLPCWLFLTWAPEDDEWYPSGAVEVLEHGVELDLRHGILTRRLRYQDGRGRRTRVVQERFVHMALPHLAGLRTTVTPENWSGPLRIRSCIDGRVENTGVARYRGLSCQHLEHEEARTVEDVDLLVVRTTQSRLRVAVAVRSRVVDGPAGVIAVRPVDEPGLVGRDLYVDGRAGHPTTVEKIASLYTSRDSAVSEPATAALEQLRNAPGFRALLDPHRRAWDSLWRQFDISVDDPDGVTSPDLLTDVRIGLFHVLQTLSPHVVDLDVGVPARGLHGEAYRGHVFWDELFLMPVLWARSPSLGRALLGYRFRRLPAARRAAAEIGCRGAMFPWQSGSDGREESQRLHLNPRSGHWLPDVTSLQRHSGLAVALTAWRLYEATGNHQLLVDRVAELVLDVALFFSSLTTYDPAKRRYVLRGVVGPDEFHTGYPGHPAPGIDNNTYTNLLVVWLLRTALRVLDTLTPTQAEAVVRRVGVTAEDRRRWQSIATRMFVPFRDGLPLQFEGYDGLAELAWDDYRERYGDISRLDRILEAEGLAVNAYKVSKQADVLMLFYLFSADEVAELLEGLGYDFDRDSIPATVDYYLERTCHGSTLSAVAHTWVLARAHRDRALAFLAEVAASDVEDTHGGTTAEGVHLAAMVGGADLLQRCFAGVEPRLDSLYVSPSWPAELGRTTFAVRYQGSDLHLTVSPTRVRVEAEPGGASTVLVTCGGTTFPLAPGQSHEVDLTAAGTSVAGGGERGTDRQLAQPGRR